MVSNQKFCFWWYITSRVGICAIYSIDHSGKYIEINFDMKIPFCENCLFGVNAFCFSTAEIFNFFIT